MGSCFSEKDLQFIKENEQSVERLNNQLKYFEKGQTFANIVKPATEGNGIVVLNAEERESYIKKFDKGAKFLDIVKFIPASGAATRMFKDLLVLKNGFNGDLSKVEDQEKLKSYNQFFDNFKKFPFYKRVDNVLKGETERLLETKEYAKILDTVLGSDGINLSKDPKAFIEFHNYESGCANPIEEHIVEGLGYAKGYRDKLKLHFTISEGHEERFISITKDLIKKYSDEKIEITYSFQKRSTDTIAVDMENKPFRDKDGDLLLRPGGHGALIDNLNTIEGDLFFVKNIDNVVNQKFLSSTIENKKLIAGYLFSLKEEINYYLKSCDDGNIDLNEVLQFIKKHLDLDCDQSLSNEEKKSFIFSALNRPLRVCGMVRNEGEPGGGPFYVKGQDGKISLQIVESAQIDRSIKENDEMIKNSTHFNPVDIVYTKRDYQGHNFNLENYIDHNQAFITEKSVDGKSLKALELPGLWNGAMADWITIFVEVPMITFNPVKVVNDLLRKEHQG
ncbi:MAG: NAD metabolism ATPase/kinase [Candidatus Cloacimonadota bacterium]|nr:MAG: NAD metabolism ATPase/kinase [Candidatus Cloacimonadota bacterium]PIE77423.1 MAG: NAD metabolism ATPase/kinase [Candidatus Delongbacteria bacterium]